MAEATLEALKASLEAAVERRRKALVAYKQAVAEAKARNAEIKQLQEEIRSLRRAESFGNKHTIKPDDDLAFFWKRTALPPKGAGRNREQKRRAHIDNLIWRAFLTATPRDAVVEGYKARLVQYKQWARNTHLHEINRLLTIPREVQNAYYKLRIYDRGISMGDYARTVMTDG